MWFTPQKAPGHLIEAFARLVEMSPSVPVILVTAGDGELFAEAEKKVAATGLEEKVPPPRLEDRCQGGAA